MASDPFAGVASPVSQQDPFAGVASPVQSAGDGYRDAGAPQASTAPAAPLSAVGKALQFWQGIKDAARYANDVSNTPRMALMKLTDAIGQATGISSPGDVAANQARQDSFAQQKTQDQAKVGGIHYLTDILANPLTYVLPGSAAGEAVPAGMTAMAGVPKVLGSQILAKVGQGAAIGNTFATMDPSATPASAGAGVVLGGAFPAAAGAISKVGKLASPSAADVLDQLGAKLGGKSPGQALQDAGNAKYNAAWDEFGKAVAPVDAQAGDVQMNYRPAIDKLEEVLGIGQRRAPMAMPDARRQVLTNLLGDLEEAGKPDGGIDNSFAGAMGVVKRLGSAQRTLAQVHGDTDAREMLGGVRDSVLDSMNQSNPGLSDSAKAARQVFATQVAPLFDKSEGGQFLTQIRDTPTPNDLLGSVNQGALTRMKADKVGIIAKGASGDPLLYSMLDAAINQSAGKPGSFVTSLTKAMPAIDQIADPATAEAFHGLVNVASTAKWTGMLANMGASAAVGHGNPALGGAGALAASFNPALSGPGLMWKLLQSPATQKLLAYAAKVPPGSPELDLIASSIAKASGATANAMNAPKEPQ